MTAALAYALRRNGWMRYIPTLARMDSAIREIAGEEGVMRIRSAVVAACTLVLVGGAVIAHAGSDITAPETIKVLGTMTKQKAVDVGKPGPSAGDTFAIFEELSDGSGAAVGTARIECTQHIGHWAICTGALVITGRGEIVGQGQVKIEGNAPFDVPITGGSGEFANVRGVDHIEPVPNVNQENHTLELIP